MGISFGNLTIAELEKRTGWTFSSDDRKWLENHRQEKTDIDPNKEEFHIFDIPFSICMSTLIKSKLINLLNKYNNKNQSKEPFQLSVRSETEKEREIRESKEKELKERQDRLNDPQSVWMVKWHMYVPVRAKRISDNKEFDLLYGCFINTFYKGYVNIPKDSSNYIKGNMTISRDEDGFRGRFSLDNILDNQIEENNYVIGSSFYTTNGTILDGKYKFDEITVRLEDGYELANSIKNYCCREIHFYTKI